MLEIILSMMHYLTELHDLFISFPTKNLVKDRGPKPSLQNKVSNIVFANSEPNEGMLVFNNPLLCEAVNLVPYWTLCLDFKIAR